MVCIQTPSYRLFACTALLMLSARAPAAAQPAAAEMTVQVSALREELVRLREELTALRRDLDQVRQGAPASAPEVLVAQVEELAQSRVESASRLPVRLSGTVLSNTFFNSGEANWLENPNIVAARPVGVAESGSVSSTVRQSRVGFEVGRIPLGGWAGSGALIADFYGGVPNFITGTAMGLPRLLYAFGRIETERTAIHVGQDHVLLAPRDPTSLAALSFPLLFRAGNLYLRAPQARLERAIGPARVAAGIVAPLAGDFGDFFEFAPAAGAGERSRRPAVQARAEFARGDLETGSGVSLGSAVQYGWRRTGTQLGSTWAAAIDGSARLGRFGVGGEFFVADNGQVFGAAVSQSGEATGGWIEGRVALSPRLDVNAGFGLDRPDDAVVSLVRRKNRSVFSNAIFRFTPELATSLEYRWLETRVGQIPLQRTNHHVNAVFAVKF